jgi:hypothetical protein
MDEAQAFRGQPRHPDWQLLAELIKKKDKCPISDCRERSSGGYADDDGNY